MDPVVEISSGSVYELDPVLSRTKSSTIHTTSSLDDSFGGSYVSSDGSDFPVHEVLGRRFQTSNPNYVFPIDYKEAQREYFMHRGLKEYFRGHLHHSPVRNPKKVADMGCGFGFFAEEFAEQYPDCQVTGVDQTPKEHQYVPDNLRYHQANYEAPEDEDGEHPAWSNPRLQDADLLFFRECAQSLVNPEKLLQNAKKTLKPGGWLEFQGLSPSTLVDQGATSPPPDSAAVLWEDTVIKTFKIVCPETDIFRMCSLKASLEEAGFVNVREEIYKLPIGEWPKQGRLRRAGACFREFNHGVKDVFAALVEIAGVMSQEEFLALHEVYREEQFNTNIRITSPFVVVYGQKPESE